MRMFALLGLLASACAPTYHQLPPLQPTDLYAPVPYQWADVDGMNIAYQDTGGDGPVVLWVHGLSSYGAFWEYQIEAFDGVRSIAIDLPGYGASDRPDASYSMAWQADVIDRFMDTMGLDSAIVAGHSMGGQIAMTLALNHPERVEALILAAPAGFERFKRGHGEWLADYYHESKTLEAPESAIRANIDTFTFNNHDEGVERFIEERVRMRDTEAFAGTSVAVARSVAAMVEGPVADRLGEIEQPTLVVFGTHDQLIPNPIFNGGRTVHVAREGVEAMPTAQLVMVKHAGHTVQHDAPDAFNTAVSAFLTQLQQ